MSSPRSIKNRFRHLFETQAWFRPVGAFIQFILGLKFRFIAQLQRLWIVIRLAKIRIQQGKKLIVIYRGIGIGDIVCTFPLVEEFRRQYPGHQIVYVTIPQSRAFVEKFSPAHNVIASSYGLNTQLPRVPAWIATKTGYPNYKGEMDGDFSGERLGFALEMAASMGISLSQPRPRITIDRTSAQALLRRFGAQGNPRPRIGIHLGPSARVKEYPVELWQELINRLHDEFGATIFRFGSKWHQLGEVNRPADLTNVPFDFTDRLNLIESTELISTMDLFIGIDSGLLHIANAVGVRAIGLFGSTNPAVILAQTTGVGLHALDLPCIFCHHRQLGLHWNTGCKFEIRCMKLIPVDAIVTQARFILEETGLLSHRAT